jgi:hypothetical protein
MFHPIIPTTENTAIKAGICHAVLKTSGKAVSCAALHKGIFILPGALIAQKVFPFLSSTLISETRPLPSTLRAAKIATDLAKMYADFTE